MAGAADPILASTLWAAHRDSLELKEASSKASTLSTGLRSVDSMLGQGLSYGNICCISGGSDYGAREVCQALLVSHLLRCPTAAATIVDTAFLLDVRKLHQAILQRLADRHDAAEFATDALDRLEIMKAFDFVGMTESLGELRDVLEGNPVPSETALLNDKAPKGTVGDSEGEDEDEMLDSPPRAPQPAPKQHTTSPASIQGPRLLIIDTITQATAPLLKNNYVQGQALLSSFMRSLAHLTRTHNLCTILLNGLSPNNNIKDETPSIFSSCRIQPALGKSFSYMLDTHLLAHHEPKTAEDRVRKGVTNEVSVIEVSHDRCGNRFGRWAAFTVDDAGLLKEVP